MQWVYAPEGPSTRLRTLFQAIAGGAVVGLVTVHAPLILILPLLMGIAVSLSFAAFTHRRTVLIAAVLWIYIQYFLTRTLEVLPKPGVWGDEACLGALLLGSLLTSCLRGETAFHHVPGWRMLVSFVALGIISGALNGLPAENVALGIRGFVQPALYYVILIHVPYDATFQKKVARLIQMLVLLQCPLVIYQIMTWDESLLYAVEDAGFGTFGFGTANMMGWMLLAFLFHFGTLWQSRQLRGSRAWSCMTLLVITWALASARVTFLFAGPLLAFTILKSRLSSYAKTLFFLGAIGLGVAGIFAAQKIFGSNLFPTDREGIEELFENQLDDKAGGGRIYYFLDTQEVARKHAPIPMIGLGPGGYSSYAGFTLEAPELKERLGHRLDDPSTGYAPDVTAVSGEFGLCGLALWYLVLIAVYRRNESTIRSIREPFWLAVARTVRILALIMLFAPLFTSAWQSPFLAGTFWVLGGLVERQRRHESEPPDASPREPHTHAPRPGDPSTSTQPPANLHTG